MAKKGKPQLGNQHFAWSIAFLTFALLCFLLLVGVYLIVGHSLILPMLASILSIVSIVFVMREKREGKLGKGKWLTSIFTAAILMGVAIFIAQTQPTVVASIGAWLSAIALIILIKEKHFF